MINWIDQGPLGVKVVINTPAEVPTNCRLAIENDLEINDQPYKFESCQLSMTYILMYSFQWLNKL